MITLEDLSTTITLPDDMLWSDEFTWQPVEQAADYGLDGAIIVQTAERQNGRPITLQSGERFAWVTRATIDQLLAWAAIPGQVLTLNIRGVSRQVVFRHHDGQVIDADMLLYHSAPDAETPYTATIRLMEV